MEERGSRGDVRGVGEHGQVSPTRSRAGAPALHTTSAAPPDQDGNIRCPELEARTRRRTESRGASSRHTRVDTPEIETSTYHKECRTAKCFRFSAVSMLIKDRETCARSTATSFACHVHPSARQYYLCTEVFVIFGSFQLILHVGRVNEYFSWHL